MNPLQTAMLCLLGISVLAFTIGYYMGRFGERKAIVDWLWDKPSPLRYGDVQDIENGQHRKGLDLGC